MRIWAYAATLNGGDYPTDFSLGTRCLDGGGSVGGWIDLPDRAERVVSKGVLQADGCSYRDEVSYRWADPSGAAIELTGYLAGELIMGRLRPGYGVDPILGLPCRAYARESV